MTLAYLRSQQNYFSWCLQCSVQYISSDKSVCENVSKTNKQSCWEGVGVCVCEAANHDIVGQLSKKKQLFWLFDSKHLIINPASTWPNSYVTYSIHHFGSFCGLQTDNIKSLGCLLVIPLSLMLLMILIIKYHPNTTNFHLKCLST